MLPADGACRHCKTRLVFVRKGNTATMCLHCDVPHGTPCKLCARMNGTVRIKDTPPEP